MTVHEIDESKIKAYRKAKWAEVMKIAFVANLFLPTIASLLGAYDGGDSYQIISDFILIYLILLIITSVIITLSTLFMTSNHELKTIVVDDIGVQTFYTEDKSEQFRINFNDINKVIIGKSGIIIQKIGRKYKWRRFSISPRGDKYLGQIFIPIAVENFEVIMLTLRKKVGNKL